MKNQQVLSLYRSILKKVNYLTYSDVKYVKSRIRSEFDKNSTLTDPDEIALCLKRAETAESFWINMKNLKSQKSLKRCYVYALSALVVTFALSMFKYYFKVTDECPFDRPSDDKIYLQNRIRFSRTLNKSTEFIMAASLRPVRVDTDTDYPGYRQESNIIYLLGMMNISPSLLYVKWNGTLILTLLLPEMSQRDRIFGGDLLDKESLKKIYDLDDVVDMSGILNLTTIGQSVQTSSPIADIYSSLGTQLLEKLQTRNITFTHNAEIVEAFHQSRFIKSYQEIQMIGYATKVAKWAHQRLAQITSHSKLVSEMDLTASFNYYTLKCGGRLSAYNPIVGFGIDSATLHFRTGENETRSYQKIPPKSNFILIDAAPEYKGYASDITRTIYPIHSSRHVLIYDMVLKCQNAAIETFQIGRLWTDVEQEAYRSLTTSLIQHDFLLKKYSLEELLLERAYYAFMPHGLGHPVGLDVHDPVPSSGKNYSLNNGIVHTIEPGVYFIPFFMQNLKVDASSIGRYLNWTTIDQYMDIGGVRIEDIVVIWNNTTTVL